MVFHRNNPLTLVQTNLHQTSLSNITVKIKHIIHRHVKPCNKPLSWFNCWLSFPEKYMIRIFHIYSDIFCLYEKSNILEKHIGSFFVFICFPFTITAVHKPLKCCRKWMNFLVEFVKYTSHFRGGVWPPISRKISCFSSNRIKITFYQTWWDYSTIAFMAWQVYFRSVSGRTKKVIIFYVWPASIKRLCFYATLLWLAKCWEYKAMSSSCPSSFFPL